MGKRIGTPEPEDLEVISRGPMLKQPNQLARILPLMPANHLGHLRRRQFKAARSLPITEKGISDRT
jgi:hypothetical protein